MVEALVQEKVMVPIALERGLMRREPEAAKGGVKTDVSNLSSKDRQPRIGSFKICIYLYYMCIFNCRLRPELESADQCV